MPAWSIHLGYRAGAIGRIVEMHGVTYAGIAGFGQEFESQVAAGLAAFAARLDQACNGLWLAVCDGAILGSVAIDGEGLGGGRAHLRWFIVDGAQRGGGIGRRLLGEAMRFVDDRAFATTELWTFDRLHAARRLYEAHGFGLAEQCSGRRWGAEVIEQRFVRPGAGLAATPPLPPASAAPSPGACGTTHPS